MKKNILLILGILLFIFVVIFCVNFLATNKISKDIDIVKNAFIINNEDVDNILDAYVYYGDEMYYVIKYESDNTKYISVIDDKEKHYIDIKLDELANIDKKEYVIGYKYDKLIYEIEKKNDSGITISYYDALTGKFIKKIKLDK